MPGARDTRKRAPGFAGPASLGEAEYPKGLIGGSQSAGDRISANAGRTIEARGQSLERVSAELGEYVRSARLRREQDWWVWGGGGAGLVAGILLTLFLPRVLPGSVDMTVALTAMNADRWSAGISLNSREAPADGAAWSMPATLCAPIRRRLARAPRRPRRRRRSSAVRSP